MFVAAFHEWSNQNLTCCKNSNMTLEKILHFRKRQCCWRHETKQIELQNSASSELFCRTIMVINAIFKKFVDVWNLLITHKLHISSINQLIGNIYPIKTMTSLIAMQFKEVGWIFCNRIASSFKRNILLGTKLKYSHNILMVNQFLFWKIK